MRIPCIKCKGSDPRNCGRRFCPIYLKATTLFRIKNKLTKLRYNDFFSSAPGVFVGHYNYPKLNIGILSPVENKNAWLYDAPRYWAEHNFPLVSIVNFRSSLLNSRFKLTVKQKTKLLEISQEIAMASKPPDVEISLKEKPRFKLNLDSYLAPTGPNAKLIKARITSNPKIHRFVDKVVSDFDLKANVAIISLYNKGFDENFITKLLSIGNLGIKTNRKIVPTRWSITATDDIIGKELLNKVKQFKEDDYKLYFGHYLGNYFLILFFPGVWSYELFETYMPKSSWNISNKISYISDYESYKGRGNYAENCGGGYYAARLAIIEKLFKLKRQASIFALRIITGDYAIPLGVWVVREAARKALKSKPIRFTSQELMLKYILWFIKKKFGYNINNILKRSILLKKLKTQKRLIKFL